MDAQARLVAAARLLEERRYGDAEIALRALLGDHPQYLQAKYDLAVASFYLGAVDEAIGLFAEVCAVNPQGLASDEFYHALAMLPDHARAIDVLERLLPRAPQSIKMIELLGRLMRERAAAAGLTPDIEVVGDSHAVAGFATIARCRVHYLGARTLHHMARQPVDLASLGVGDGAKLVLVFGEIDCRVHLLEMAEQIPAEVLCRRLAADFVKSVGRTIERGGVAAAAISAVLPPPLAHVESEAFPMVGPAEARRDMAVLLNRALADAAGAAGIGFLDIGRSFTDADGFLDPARSDGLVHVSYRENGPIAACLSDLFDPAPTR